MKLDATEVRYISGDEYRVLTAVEMGSKNHEVVPVPLIAQISGLRSGGVSKCIGELAKRNLCARVQGAKYDGYRLTYGGYDFLAMRTFAKRDTVYSVGNQIGTGKESDIYVVANDEGEKTCLKIHRLGRISFRTIKSKRDYLRQGQSASWMYMSRLAAMKEYAFMKILYENGFPVPKPIDQARHCIIMELIDAFPLRQISEIANPGKLYSELMDLIVRLARSGLIHGDFNEFNILVREDRKEGENGEEEVVDAVPILIDFPQMVSTDHENAEYYFNRDVSCIRTFFKKRFRYESTVYPRFSTFIKDGIKDFELDVQVAASGFGKKDEEALERYMRMVEAAEANEEGGEEDGTDDEDEEEEEEEEDDEEAEPKDEKHQHLGIDECEATDSGRSEEAKANREVEAVDDLRTKFRSTKLESERSNGRDELESEDEAREEREGDNSSSHDSEAQDDDNEEEQQTRRIRKAKGQSQNREARDIRSIVLSNMERNAKTKERKHHGKKNINAAGRSKGSKMKANPQSSIRDSAQF